MSAEAAVAAGRAAAEALMVDNCTITRAGTGRGPINEGTGRHDAPPRVTIYTGKCQVQVPNVAERQVVAGEDPATVLPLILKLPVAGSEDVRVDDVAVIDHATLDAALIGRRYTVQATHTKTFATARRLRCSEVM